MIVVNSVVVSLMYACMFPILRSESKKKKPTAERAFKNRYICLILE